MKGKGAVAALFVACGGFLLFANILLFAMVSGQMSSTSPTPPAVAIASPVASPSPVPSPSPVASPSPVIVAPVIVPTPVAVPSPKPTPVVVNNYGCVGCSFIDVKFYGTQSIMVDGNGVPCSGTICEGGQVVTYTDPGVILGSSAANIASDIKAWSPPAFPASAFPPLILPGTLPFASWWAVTCTEVFSGQKIRTVVLNDGSQAGGYAATTICDANSS
jgi:hypothetical protein